MKLNSELDNRRDRTVLNETMQVILENSAEVNEAIRAQKTDVESLHKLLELVAPVNQSEAIALIVKLQRSYYIHQNFRDEVYRFRTADEGDYCLQLLDDAWRKSVGITA